jgi:hypothetical protein
MQKKKQVDLSAYSDDTLDKIAKNLDIFEREFPSLFLKPNVAQYRAFETIYTKINGRYPDLISVEFANGVGKTTAYAMDVIGWTMGPAYLQEALFPPVAIEFWKTLEHDRDLGRLAMRLVCSAIDMKEGGSVCDILKKFFPWARPTKQDNTGSYKQIDIPHPTIPGIINHIAVLTFDQEPEKHAGPTCDRIWVNENLPDNLWGETNARTRGGGNIVQFATVLNHSTYMNELEDTENFVFERCKGHIYENCVGEDLTDEMADEVYRKIGIRLEKSPEGKGYITGGTNPLKKVLSIIDGWKASPEEKEARMTGLSISEGGKIFPMFNPEVHRIPDEAYKDIPTDWPMVMLCDPHPARPDAVIWVVILSSDRLAIIDEWPTYNEFGYYDKIKECRFTLKQKCGIWLEFEAARGYHTRVGDNRVGDPNRFLEPDEQTMGNLSDLYRKEGFSFNLAINDNFEFGRELVNQYLWYDASIRKNSPSDPAGKPRLVIYARCVNTLRALGNFARKANRDKTAPISESVDKRYECFAALVRYLCVWHQTHHFSDVRISENRVSDYELVKRSRIPVSLRDNVARGPHNLHGRKVLSYAR